MRLLVLTADMSRYRGALYQQDVLRTFAKHSDVVLYGPGVQGFKPGLRAREVLARLHTRPDAVIVAHSWLHDAEGAPTTRDDALDPREFDLPVLVMLNKEYARLELKLEWIAQQRPLAVLTHHHEVERYASLTGVAFVFWPFAVDTDRFRPGPAKTSDIGFSGILQNPHFPSMNSDMRLQLQRRLYHHHGQIRLHRRADLRDIQIDWRTFTGQRTVDIINQLLHGNHRLSENDYAAALAQSRMWINGPSPLNLVGTRYFECMATETLVLSPRFPELDLVFEPDCFVTFDSADDLIDKVRFYRENDSLASAIASRAREGIQGAHTWNHRIHQLLELL